MSFHQFVEQQRNFFNQFQQNKTYKCKIFSQSDDKKVLQPGRIETFGYGYVLASNNDKFNLEFEIYNKFFNQNTGDFQLIGRIKNPQNNKYLLAMEKHQSFDPVLKIGYNSHGDETILNVRDTLSVQGLFQFVGTVQVQRDNQIYYLRNSDDKFYLKQGSQQEQSNQFVICLDLMAKQIFIKN